VDTKIKFVFFGARDLDKPIIATSFGRHRGRSGDWFIVPGPDKHYCYAYQESQIKYMVTELQVRARTGPIALYDVKLTRMTHKTKDDDIANLGNHIDFSILKSRSEAYFSIHWTIYDEGNGDLNSFTRNSTRHQCSILPDEDKIMSKDFVEKAECVNNKNIPVNVLPDIFDEVKDRVLIHDLCKASIGVSAGKKMVVVGGTDSGGPKRYKGLYVIGPEFFKFVADTFIRPLTEHVLGTIGSEAISVCQYFDEESRLHDDGGKSIQYIVEFGERRVVAFSISAHRAIKACWTSLNKNDASEKEKKCLRQWLQTCTLLLSTDFSLKEF
jgi:hypothetical protein